MKIILKTLIGSRAHHLHTEASDYDYRGVYIEPTIDFFKLDYNPPQTSWIEGKNDNTSWELSKFLMMAVRCNPTILEVFKAPIIESTEEGANLVDLFDYIWNPSDVLSAFTGYGHNQQKKFLENKDNRAHKYAAAYVRVIYNAYDLLTNGTFSLDLRGTPIFDQVKRYKNGDYTIGEVMDTAYYWEKKAIEAYEIALKQNKYRLLPDYKKINDFIINVRKNNWS